MIAVLTAAVVGLAGRRILGTPLAIRLLVRHGYGQLIRDDGPTSHHTKRGTPTMGGAVIILAALAGYFVAHLVRPSPADGRPALLVLFLMTGLGVVGFARRLHQDLQAAQPRPAQRSQARRPGARRGGLRHRSRCCSRRAGRTRRPPTRLRSSATRRWCWRPVLFVVWALIMIAAASNGVNLTDGLDGLATGACVMVFGAYT